MSSVSSEANRTPDMLFEASVCRDKHGRCYDEQEESPKKVPHVLVVMVVTALPAD